MPALAVPRRRRRPARAGSARWTRQSPRTAAGSTCPSRQRQGAPAKRLSSSPGPDWDAMGCRTTPGPCPNALSEGRRHAFSATQAKPLWGGPQRGCTMLSEAPKGPIRAAESVETRKASRRQRSSAQSRRISELVVQQAVAHGPDHDLLLGAHLQLALNGVDGVPYGHRPDFPDFRDAGVGQPPAEER